jgi:hypothetical protein
MMMSAALSLGRGAGGDWRSDSPMTNRLSLYPVRLTFGEVATVAAYEPWDGRAKHVVTLDKWLTFFTDVADRFFSPTVTVVPHETLPTVVAEKPLWLRIKDCGEYALEISQILGTSTCGARLVSCDDETVLQYRSDLASNTTITFGPTSASMSWPITTNEPLEEGAFLMDVEEDTLAAMDEYERRLEDRYKAAGARDARAMQFDRE